MWRAGLVVAMVAGAACGGDDAGAIGPITADGLVRACAIVSACEGSGGFGVDDCVGELGPTLTREQVACVTAASLGDCDLVRVCLGYRIEPDLHCERGCLDAETVVQCTETTRILIDCPRFFEQVGPSCVAGAQRLDCGGGTCDLDGERWCSGTIATVCDAGVTQVRDCARWGLACDAGGCVGAADGACVPGTAAECDGERIVECVGATRRSRDCGQWIAGMTCTVPTPAMAVCGYGTECDVRGFDTCDGTTLTACVAGARHTIDCRSIGGRSCFDGDGIDGLCRP